jgi:formylglycine-generating enzyme required for sulfatase activity
VSTRVQLGVGSVLLAAVLAWLALRKVPVTKTNDAPSCKKLAPTCGPAKDEDCCAARVVEGGTFVRSHDPVGCPKPGPPATVSSFALDRFEVTVGRFRAFVDAGGGVAAHAPREGEGAHPKIAGSGWRADWNDKLAADRASLEQKLHCGATSWDKGDDRLPINCVDFYEAFAFCAWDGGRLPTEAEWNYAAAGGDEQRTFPWRGITVDPSRAVYARPSVEPVGMHPAGDGRYGQADLAGNVWEWTIDTADTSLLLPAVGRDRCDLSGYPSPCLDCASTAKLSGRVLRGGGFGIPAEGLYSSLRRASAETDRFHVFGIRCARDTSKGTNASSTVTVSATESAELAGGFEKGDRLPDLPLRLRESGDRLVDRTISTLWNPRPRYALVDLATAWSERSRGPVSARLGELSKTTCARAVTLLLEGERPGQASDSYNLFSFVSARHLAHDAAFDATGRLPARAGTRARTLLVDMSTLEVLAEDAGDLDEASPLRQMLVERCGKL